MNKKYIYILCYSEIKDLNGHGNSGLADNFTDILTSAHTGRGKHLIEVCASTHVVYSMYVVVVENRADILRGRSVNYKISILKK